MLPALHSLGPILHLLAHVPVGALVRYPSRVAIPHREGVEAGHDARRLPVAFRAGDGLRSITHVADGLDNPVAVLAVVLVERHFLGLPSLARLRLACGWRSLSGRAVRFDPGDR